MTLAFSVLFLLFFVLGITRAGQETLRGTIPSAATHREIDDIYMGAGLAPWLFGLVPAAALALISTGLFVGDLLKHRR